MRISGLYAALATPVGDTGHIDLDGVDRLCDFVLARGAPGICLGGATSEYPRFETADRLAVLRRVTRRLPPDVPLVVAIGASSIERTLDLGRAAFDEGSRAVLVPMPWFFPYEQDDLAAYAAHVARALPGPCLLYDLPEFTTALAADTILDLLAGGQAAGIKDSSGGAERLERFASARGNRDWSLLAGDDRCGLAAARAGWDGAVSGLACCCPELLVALRGSIARGDAAEAERYQSLVNELAARVGRLPAPWGVRVALAARGCDIGPTALPPSPRRAAAIADLAAWLPPWLDAAGIPGLRR